jgi:hypothetical protein
MHIEERLITKISTYTPKDTIVDHKGNIVEVIPKNDTQVYLTFEDGDRDRVLWLDGKTVGGVKLFSFAPVEEGKTTTSRDIIVGRTTEDVKYEILT